MSIKIIQLLYISESLKGTVKPVLSGHSMRRPKIGFQDRLSLNAGQKYCRLLQRSILQSFRPSLSYHLSLRPLFCLFLSGCSRQVLLYFVIDTLKQTYKWTPDILQYKCFIFNTIFKRSYLLQFNQLQVQGVHLNYPPRLLFLNIRWKWNNLVSVRPNYFIFMGYLRKMRYNQQREPPTPLYI